MTLSPAEQLELDRLVARQADDLEWLRRVDEVYPLATSVLWTAPSAAWDQRRMVAAAMAADEVSVTSGGWRSGKSEGLKQLTLAMALGGAHPAVRSWLALNDLPTTVIPDHPAEVYAIAPSSNDSIKYHRPHFARMLGGIPHSWMNAGGKGEAKVEFAVPGYREHGKIWFKSTDQTRRAFQGISIRWWWHDEEPLGEVGYGVIDECMARVADQSGRGGITMVGGMEGITWVAERFVRARERNAVIIELDSLDNPYLPKERFESMFAGMTDDEVAVRRFGRFRSRSGAIYPMFAAGDGDRWGPGHTCAPFQLPQDWPNFRMADFGLVNPTCVLWAALGDDDTVYVYDEYYVPNGESYAWHAEQVRQQEQGHGRVIEAGWGDPSAKEARDEFARAGLWCAPANNDYAAGYDQIRERLRLAGDHRPRLKIFSHCNNLINELRGLIWDPNRVDKVQVKRHDHAPDALRYGILGIGAWRGL